MAENMFEGTALSEALVMEDLEILRGYCEEIEVESMLIPRMRELPLPALAAVLEDDEQGRLRVLTMSFLPVDREDVEYTKYLQSYLELQNSLEGVSRTELLELLMWINARISVGCCILREPEGDRPLRVAIRASQGFPLQKPVDMATFTENLLLFDGTCDVVSGLLDLLAEGRTFREICEITAEEA